MAKRTLEEVGSSEVKKEGRDKKRSRKEKIAVQAAGDNGGVPINIDEPTEGETKEARKQRKKLAKAMRLALGTTTEVVHQTSRLDDLAAKAARKIERAVLRAKKEANLHGLQQPAEKDTSILAGHQSLEPLDLNKNYSQNAELSGLPQSEVDTFLTENFISITDPTATTASLRPITKFSYLPSGTKQDAFKSFKAPTPIQASAWPFLLSGRDVIGVAETGSGKTMAFAVPCVRYITSLRKPFIGAKAVVVSPTRELAMQSFDEITKLASVTGLQAVCVYGGVPKDAQRKALKTADIVVATPGRLNDLINEGSADLSMVGYVVLDEADRMLDKGFEEEIRKIINTALPLGKRQTLMFTATWPESVRTLAATFMTSPVKIAIGDNPSGDLRANARIVQKVEVVDPRNKEFRLLQLLKQYQSGSQKDDRILVFCLYKKEATRVESFIRSKGIRVAGIHGDLSQEQRTRSLDAFKQGGTPVLVATDVAARGLDIPAVKLVLNMTFPLTVSILSGNEYKVN
jgi:ATP-dependent RNA helicase DBP3